MVVSLRVARLSAVISCFEMGSLSLSLFRADF